MIEVLPSADIECRPDDAVKAYLDQLAVLLRRLDVEQICAIIRTLIRAHHDGRYVFVVGNGGSATTASHFACDLGKNTVPGRAPRFKALALTDNVAMITAWANDVAYDQVFAEQLENFVQPGDVVVAISGSGNSPNVLNAVLVARERGAVTIGLTGFHGGKLEPLCDICVVVPSDAMDQIEDAHLALQHLICRTLRDILAAEPEQVQRPLMAAQVAT